MLIVDWRGRACKIIYLINFGEKWLSNIMPNQLEIRVANEVLDILFATRVIVIKANDIVPLMQKPFAQV
jgi:hypothetical protein